MSNLLCNFFQGIKFGIPQQHGNMAVVPILNGQVESLEYVLLGVALKKGGVTVTEVSEGGSVPDLKVINHGNDAVLMLDGEELSGAKQNRVLNTTILLGGKQEAVIPVSCTEQGRWSYASAEFQDSGEVMHRAARSYKMQSVTSSLRMQASYQSDQAGVWDQINELHTSANTQSSTGAMRDAYEQRRQDLNMYLGAFDCVDHQRGCLVFIGGKVAGLDVVSRSDAYAGLHDKLMRSYAMDALVGEGAHSDGSFEEAGHAFLDVIASCTEQRFPSVGLGEDCRYQGSLVVGAILDVDTCVVHAAFFVVDPDERRSRSERMASYQHRARSYQDRTNHFE